MLDLDKEVICIKDGQMLPEYEGDTGKFFCYKGDTYWATIVKDDRPEEEDFYYVQDALYNELDKEPHGMDKEFFDEYFEFIDDDQELLKDLKKEQMYLEAKKRNPGKKIEPCGIRDSLLTSFEEFGGKLSLWYNVGKDTKLIPEDDV